MIAAFLQAREANAAIPPIIDSFRFISLLLSFLSIPAIQLRALVVLSLAFPSTTLLSSTQRIVNSLHSCLTSLFRFCVSIISSNPALSREALTPLTLLLPHIPQLEAFLVRESLTVLLPRIRHP